jgi:hypothetical protein
MTLRVVVYSEGPTDLAGEIAWPPTPGEPLSEGHLGPVHILVRRVLALKVPEPAVRFEAPLRVRGGREARGSDLHHERTLRQLLRWPRVDRRPDLAVVIVDADDERGRARRLEVATEDVGVARVVGAAVCEFESWLVADALATSRCFARTLPTTKDPEAMRPREAKELLSQWLGEAVRDGARSQVLRRNLAEICELELVARRCPSFADLMNKIARA